MPVPLPPRLRDEPGRYILCADLGRPWDQLAAIAHRLHGPTAMPLVPVRTHRDGSRTVSHDPIPGLGEQVGDPWPGAGIYSLDDAGWIGRDPKAIARALSGTEPDPGPWKRIEALLHAVTDAGAAAGPEPYAAAYNRVFEILDAFEATLTTRRYLGGRSAPTLDDWALLCVLVRFDPVYYGLYKCNRQRIADFPQLSGYVRDLYQGADIADTFDFEAIKRVHYLTDSVNNPKGLIPLGNGVDLLLPHDRLARFDAAGLRATGIEEQSSAPTKRGEWVRPQSRHRDTITADGSSGFEAEAGRYHLYIANNCPWCHRTVVARALKGLQDVVTMDVLFYRRDPERGWQFRPEEPGCTDDRLFGNRFIKELYERLSSPEKSVPVLYDRKTDTIVNNESADIIRMFNAAFDGITNSALDLYPAEHRAQIDQLNAWIYTDINNGAYKAGFAASQAAYETAYTRLFAALERLDRILEDRRFLVGDALTEADVRLFPTIFRFDHVYYTRFRLDARMVREYRHLYRWLRTMLDVPGVADASNLDHCKKGYFGRTGNNIVPLGPGFGFEA